MAYQDHSGPHQPADAGAPPWHNQAYSRTQAYPIRGATPTRGRSPLSPGRKAAVYLGGGALAVLLLCCGGLGVIGAVTDDPQQTERTADDAPVAAAPADGAATASPTATASSTASPTAPVTTAPAVETRTVTETRAIPYGTRTVKDSTLAKGTRKTRTNGVAGVRTLTYEVTFTNGVETGRRLLSDEVTRKPVSKVVAVGTKTSSPKCDPNYSGACVPISSDVDCAGGSGNGPAYVHGPVRVVGSDIYDLDRDGDGVGCD
jgi:hypothetical protein